MYILSLSFGLSIQNSVNSWPDHFKISKVVVDKRTSGCRCITSSIYLNWNISVIYCRIEIKLVSIKENDGEFYFVRITFLNCFRSRRHDVIKLSIADISLILHSIDSLFGHRSHDSPWCHMKYYVTLKVTLTFGVNGKVNAYSFYRLIFPCVTPSILDRISSNYQLWSLTKKLPVG